MLDIVLRRNEVKFGFGMPEGSVNLELNMAGQALRLSNLNT
jgi:hypothetical protein